MSSDYLCGKVRGIAGDLLDIQRELIGIHNILKEINENLKPTRKS